MVTSVTGRSGKASHVVYAVQPQIYNFSVIQITIWILCLISVNITDPLLRSSNFTKKASLFVIYSLIDLVECILK